MSEKTREEALAHFGVRGMRWGVRNEEEPIGSKPKAAKEIKKPVKMTETQLIEYNKKKWAKKFEKDEAQPEPKKGWRPSKKQLIIAGIGAAYVANVAYNVHAMTSDPTSSGFDSMTSLKSSLIPVKQLRPGQHCSASQYLAMVHQSQGKSWGYDGYIQASSYLREDMTFPVGHVFHRLSKSLEDSFSGATYCTSSVDEFARYIASFREEIGTKGLHHVTWKATEQVKVPSLNNTLETLRLAIKETQGREATLDQAKAMYQMHSGGSWSHNDPLVGRFFEMLKNQGYHAIVDEMDAGVLSETPLVWINELVASKKTSNPLTNTEVKEALSILTEIAHRK